MAGKTWAGTLRRCDDRPARRRRGPLHEAAWPTPASGVARPSEVMRVHAPFRLLALLLTLAFVAFPVRPAAAALIGTAQEVQIGRDAARELEAEVGVVRDPARTARVAALGGRLAARSTRPELPWTFKVLDTGEVNAVSLPGGFIYVTRGLLGFVTSDDELAFVLAHEVAHVDRRHHVQLLERHFLFSIVITMLFGGDPTAASVANFVRFLLQRGFSREAEFEADRVGLGLVQRAGFAPPAALRFLERLRAAEGRDPSQFEVFFRTHPALADRIQRVRTQLRTMGYQAWTRPRAPL